VTNGGRNGRARVVRPAKFPTLAVTCSPELPLTRGKRGFRGLTPPELGHARRALSRSAEGFGRLQRTLSAGCLAIIRSQEFTIWLCSTSRATWAGPFHPLTIWSRRRWGSARFANPDAERADDVAAPL